MNYREPVRLHDYRYLGDAYRERDRIKRKKACWMAKLQRMQPQERYALLSAISAVFDTMEEENDYANRPQKLPARLGGNQPSHPL